MEIKHNFPHCKVYDDSNRKGNKNKTSQCTIIMRAIQKLLFRASAKAVMASRFLALTNPEENLYSLVGYTKSSIDGMITRNMHGITAIQM